ncbi:SH2 domain-containing protein 3C-like isoform X1 [Salvelinus fontinalis]|uniref:SH2 domain-containing protein 3C-like isoform X1 n=1 Tax=Salvelinus fontinalis TaxID=8038 RepID=UPI00248572D3|nr:SH2 domain-containing protein 3C-like isoform X1 [Salvelinus fontinalis]
MSGKRKLSFKWLGSLSNLSFRRGSSSEKSPSKPDGGRALDVVSSPDAAETSVDDMDMTRPRTSSYARSSDNYTHMGTLPRLLLRKRDKSGNSVKGGTKKGAGLGRSQSQRPAGDHVCSSPLLTALSSKPGSRQDQPGSRQDQPGSRQDQPGSRQDQPGSRQDQPGSRQDQPRSPLSSQAGPGPKTQQAQGLPPLPRGGSLSRSKHKDPQAHCEEGKPQTSQLMSAQAVGSATASTASSLVCDDVPEGNTFPPDQGVPSPDTASTGGARRNLPPVPGQSVSMSLQRQVTIQTEEPSPTPKVPKKSLPGTQVTQHCEEGFPRERADNLGTDSNSSSLPEMASCGSSGRDLQRETHPGEPVNSHMDPTDSQDEYVKFSKEKYLLESAPEKLHTELEEELKLCSSDIRSHGWYHGHIPREVSETVVLRNGDFLIRDSLINVGDYVLTTRWNYEVLHIKITKVLVKSTTESKVQYLLEKDSFDSIPELKRYYVAGRRPVSQPSGALIYCPIIRTLPLRYLEATFALANSRHGLAHSPSSQKGAYIKRRSVTMNDGLTTDKLIPHSSSTIHNHKDAMRNCALSMDLIQEHRRPPLGETPLSPAYSHIHRHRTQSGVRVLAVVPPSPVLRHFSDPQLSPGSNNNLPDMLAASSHSTPAHCSYETPGDGSETGSSYCNLRPTPALCPKAHCAAGMPPTPPTKSYVERLRVEEGRGPAPGREDGAGEEAFIAPLVETASSFRPGMYVSHLMPQENKPLEMSILKRVKELLAEVDVRTAARHITMADCTVARILGVTEEMQRMMGVGSGLELLTLPHGHQLRLDLLERFYTMSIMTAVDLLGCTGSKEERAALLHKTIQLAAELKSNLGNMFGFAAVMRALELPQISRLEQTWMTLRQRHTEGAILYEKKLKPFMKNMNDGKESTVLSNTSFPHVVPLLSLLERSVAVGEGPGAGIESWEKVQAGVDVVMSHLEAARTIAHHGGLYRTNAETKLQGFQEREEVLEIFRTEFQMRLLWGSRGSEGSQSERYEKFDKVLTALSHKLEPLVRHSEL